MFQNTNKYQQIFFHKLLFNNKPIAIFIGFFQGSNVFAFKISYDDTFSKYSPGILLMIDSTTLILNNNKRLSVDSCAVPNHPMINSLWKQKRLILSPQLTLNNPFIKHLFLIIKLIKSLRGRL